MTGVSTRDFFLSRAGEDKVIAATVDKILRDAGYTTFIQDRDFGSTAFTERMDEGFAMVEAGARIVTLLSPTYLNKPHCIIEARYPLIDDPSNKRQRLVVLRIGECAPPGFLKPIPYADLVPVLHDLVKLRAKVLHAVDPAKHPLPADLIPASKTQQQIRHPNVSPLKSFAQRAPEMQGIERALWAKSGSNKAALTNNLQANVAMRGLGGVGKSVLARQYAWENKDRYQGVWWLRAEQKETLLDDLVDLGARIVDPGLKAHPNPAEAAQATLDHLNQHHWDRPWLLIYDNAESPDALRGLTPDVNTHVLITTRCQDWYGEATELPVGVFPRETAIAYLMDLARGNAEHEDKTRTEASSLADALGCLPLALAIARAQAWGNNWSFAEYRQHLDDMLTRLPTKAVDYPMSLFAAFTLSFDKAAATAPFAEQLMALAAFLNPDEIPLDLFGTDIMPVIEKGEAVAALSAQSLVTPATFADGTPAISVHRLVQQVMRARLGDDASAVAAGAVELLSGAFKMPVYSADLPVTVRLAPHAISALDHVRGTPDWHSWNLADELAQWQHSRGDRPSASQWYARALDMAQRRLADDPGQPQLKRDVSISYERIADVLKEEGNRPAALINYQKSLAIREQLAADDPGQPQLKRDVSISYERIADVLKEEGNRPAALINYQKSLAIREQLAADDPGQPQLKRDVSISLNKIGDVLKEEGNRPAALINYQKSLAIREQLAADDPGQPQLKRDVSISYERIADVLKEEGNRPAALINYQKSLAIAEQLAADDPGQPQLKRDVSISYERIADVLKEEGNRPAALINYQKSLAIREQLAADDPGQPQLKRDVSISYERIADVLKEEGNRPAALINYQKSLAIAEQLAADDPGQPQLKRDVSISYERIADVYAADDRSVEAAAALKRALGIYDDLVRQYPDDVTSRVFSVVPHIRLANLDPLNARHHLEAALAILRPLAAEGRLDAMRRGWIPGIEAQLAAPPPKSKRGVLARLFGRG